MQCEIGDMSFEAVTLEELDHKASQIKVLTDSTRSLAFPGGKPDWMPTEQWTKIAGEEV